MHRPPCMAKHQEKNMYHPLSQGILTLVLPIAAALLIAAKYSYKSTHEIKSNWGTSALLLMTSLFIGTFFLLISQVMFHLASNNHETIKTIAITMTSYFLTLSWTTLKLKQNLLPYIIYLLVGSVALLSLCFFVILIFSCITSDTCL